MELLSAEPVSNDLLDRLRADLQRADILRFVVAYISTEGLNAIGIGNLLRPLRDPRSFGVSSLACNCGYEPLLTLNNDLGIDGRLKYFMEPLPEDDESVSSVTRTADFFSRPAS